MDNEQFLRELNRDLVSAKEEMKSRNEDTIKELNNYKKMFDEEMEREEKKAVSNPLFDNEEGEEIFSDLIRRDADFGAMLDFSEMDEEGYDIVMSLAKNDPTFALSFLERRRYEIPSDKYQDMKNELLDKLDIN